MQEKSVNICICSESEDVNPLVSLLNGLHDDSIRLVISSPSDVVVEIHDIILFYLDRISDALLGSMEKAKFSSQARSSIIVEGNDIHLLSTLAKMGFDDLFVFPYELYKFHSYITELIQGFKLPASENKNVENPDLSFLGNFPGIENLISLARKAAENPSLNVLLLGDTGTGKSVLAKLIHTMGEKKPSPFIHVICTAIPEDLLESELFGYEKGAFTDAKNRKVGLFELAEGGTIFLDEIGDLSMHLQAKLLHVTEKKVIRRLGGVKDISINTRIITATNRNIRNQIEKNLFRRDLFYRLNMITLTLPPLAERDEDIVLLTEHYVKEFSRIYGKSIRCLSDQAWSFIRNYNWPGNVRELRHIIERAVLLSEGPVLDEKYFTVIDREQEQPEPIVQPERIVSADTFTVSVPLPAVNGAEKIILELKYQELTLTDLNKIYARQVLEKLGGNKTKTAKLLGISRPTLDNLLN